jgi:hypothetical protein
MSPDSQLERRLRSAIKHFWNTRAVQAQKQGSSSGSKDAGARSAVTGGAQMNGFIELVRDLLCESGLPKAGSHSQRIPDCGLFLSPHPK